MIEDQINQTEGAMRTSGTFQDVYEAAKNYSNGGTTYGGRPMNPVVRRRASDGVWMLESGLDSAEGSDLECSLDAFDNWFYESYKTDYIPGDEDIADFATTITEDIDNV